MSRHPAGPLPLALALAVAGCYVGFEAGEDTDGTTGAATTTSGSPTSGSPTSGSPTSGTPTSGSPTSGPGTTGPATTGDVTATSGPATTDVTATSGPASSTGPDDMSTGTGAVDTGPPGSTGDGTTGGPQDPNAAVCARWNADRADLSEGAWSGDTASCNKGDVAAPGRENARRQVNLYRWLAALPEVAEEPTWSAKAQACALMMHANGQLSHSPPMNWKCYAAEGAEAAGKSNIATGPGVSAVDLYMVDPGNPTTMGHRRWILSNSLGPIGMGSTSGYSCLWVIGGQGQAGKPWTAWPPPGIVPIEAIHVPEIGFSDVDKTGWTIQSDSIDVGAATITITEGGANRAVQKATLQSGYGSKYAVSLIPQGWTTAAGKTYTVKVDGVPQPFSYDVQVVKCE